VVAQDIRPAMDYAVVSRLRQNDGWHTARGSYGGSSNPGSTPVSPGSRPSIAPFRFGWMPLVFGRASIVPARFALALDMVMGLASTGLEHPFRKWATALCRPFHLTVEAGTISLKKAF
jgi:hypothetical protein